MKFSKKIVGFFTVATLLTVGGVQVLAASLTTAQAKEIAKKYVPQNSTYLGTEEEYNKIEVKLFKIDTFYEIDIDKATQKPLGFESKLFNDSGSQAVKLTVEDVKKVVLAEIPKAQILSVQLETDDHLKEYKVRFYTEENSGSYKINPENGEILERDITFGGAKWIKAHQSSAVNGTLQTPTTAINVNPTTTVATTNTANTNSITIEQAKEIAIAKAPGATVWKIKLDTEHGRLVYEVELRKGNIEYEAEIDAITGAILEWDVDIDD